jgi:dimethylamine/trimethylamine dehydrogenase
LNPFTHDPVPGADATEDWLLTPDQIMVEGKTVPGERAIVYDCDGYFMGSSLAQKLALEGKRVTLVTPHATAAPFCFLTGEGFELAKELAHVGVEVAAAHTVSEVRQGHVVASHGGETVEWETDSLVLVTQRVSEDALYRELKGEPAALEQEGIRSLYRIGDCVVPRIAAECIFDGHRLGREIDSPNPATALPYIREHRVLGARDEDYDGSLQSARVAGAHAGGK